MTPSPDLFRLIESYVGELAKAIAELPVQPLAQTLELLQEVRKSGHHVYIAGNGGSASTASHIANDLLKGAALGGGRPIRAISLADNVPVMTAIANDVSYDEMFAAQLQALAVPGDLLILISGSGNSPNIIRAAEVAREIGVKSVGFLGKGGGAVAELVDVSVVVESDDYGAIETAHVAIDHVAMTYLSSATASLASRDI